MTTHLAPHGVSLLLSLSSFSPIGTSSLYHLYLGSGFPEISQQIRIFSLLYLVIFFIAKSKFNFAFPKINLKNPNYFNLGNKTCQTWVDMNLDSRGKILLMIPLISIQNTNLAAMEVTPKHYRSVTVYCFKWQNNFSVQSNV